MNNIKKASFLLCIVIAIIIAVPVGSEIYFERIRHIKPISTNIYEFDFIEHWKQVTDALNLNERAIETARIEGFDVDYKESGQIKNLIYEITWQEKKQFYHALVSFNEYKNNIEVKAIGVSDWLQYDSMFRANSLFRNLKKVDIKELTSKDSYSFYGFSIGVWDEPAFPDGEIFTFEGNRIVSLKRNKSVKGYYIRTYCMEQYAKNAYRSAKNEYYLVNLQ